MNALRDVSRVWLVAKMVHTLFESILGNKQLEERLQKAAGRRHNKNKGANGTATAKANPSQVSPPSEARPTGGNEGQKRTYDDMEFGFTNGPPAPQMSYERSRPQSPALTPQPNVPQQQPPPQQHQQMPQLSTGSPNFRQSGDTFGGASRSNTRPTTPFNPWGGTRPSTPDFFLHTRNSPKISDDLWQNYEPGQLFPSEINGAFSLHSPGQTMVDPALRGPPQQHPHQFNADSLQQQSNTTPSGMQPHQQIPMQQHHNGNAMQPDGSTLPPNAMMYGQQEWPPQMGMERADDTWSSSSYSGPIVPTTLNVGDWFEFFGIPNGDLSALNAGVGGYG